MLHSPLQLPCFVGPPPGATPDEADAHWMRLAVWLARRAEGLTRPNPAVGAVIVGSDGRCIGFGTHRRAGTPHAEIHALRRAGDRARSSTLYVTLEPCSTTGRTPPCVRAILAAGVRRVVIGTLDPNPKHAGRAVPILREAGIRVDGPCEGDACRDLLQPFATVMTHGRPFFRLKLGMTLDARLADSSGTSQWITSPSSREAVQNLRRRSDAILVGAGTLRADNPSLLPRPSRGRQPWRVICARVTDLPLSAQVFTDAAAARTIVAAPAGWHPETAAALRARGVTVLELPADEPGFFRSLAEELKERGILSVLCEGGAHLAGALLRNDLIDELHLFVAPLVLGAGALPLFAGLDLPLAKAARFQILSATPIPPDLHVVAQRGSAPVASPSIAVECSRMQSIAVENDKRAPVEPC